MQSFIAWAPFVAGSLIWTALYWLVLRPLFLRFWRRRRARTPEMYAIEFGEYLAKAAERYQVAVSRYHNSDDEDGVADGDELVDAFIALNSAIHEFRKRAMRVVIPT